MLRLALLEEQDLLRPSQVLSPRASPPAVVIPAKAGIQAYLARWTPAFAGVTTNDGSGLRHVSFACPS
jgi:hypothetical protein